MLKELNVFRPIFLKPHFKFPNKFPLPAQEPVLAQALDPGPLSPTRLPTGPPFLLCVKVSDAVACTFSGLHIFKMRPAAPFLWTVGWL